MNYRQRLNAIEWGNFIDWPLPRRGAVCALLALAAFALPWVLWTRPAATRAAALAVRADGLQAELTALRQRIADAPVLPASPGAAGAASDPPALPERVAALAQMAQARGLSGGQFRPQQEEARIGAYRGSPVALRVAGSWPQLVAFVADLAAPVDGMPVSLDAVAVRAQPADAGNGSRAEPLELHAIAYLWQPGADAPDVVIAEEADTVSGQAIPDTAGLARNPFARLRNPPQPCVPGRRWNRCD